MQSLIRQGFLPVTMFGAQPNDADDDTDAIQRAIDQALHDGLVAFFPAGTYIVSETIRAMQPVTYDERNRRWVQDRRQAHAMVGSTKGTRPVLKLSDQSRGFDDPTQPKPLVRIWAQPRDSERAGSKDPEHEQPNISFNQIFKGIDINLTAPRNSGAIGIQHTGSQGSAIVDVTILANNAYAGLVNPPGQGGGVYNVEVVGGEYGIWADHRARYPVIAGVKLTGQTGPALFWKGQSNLTLAGFAIERANPEPAIYLEERPKPYNAALTLVDGIIETRGGRAIENSGNRSLIASNVFIRGSAEIVKSGAVPPISSPGDGWIHVANYANAPPGAVIVQDGIVSGNNPQTEVDIRPAGNAPDSHEILTKHRWTEIPSFEDDGIQNVLDFGAIPNDGQDDSEAFSRALARGKAVFVPKGVFDVGETIVIPADRRLFGAAKHLSIIRARNWKQDADPTVIRTADDAKASTSISSLMIENDSERHITLLEWRAGGRAVVSDLIGAQTLFRRIRHGGSAPTFSISDSGGGRWFGVAAEWNAMRAGTHDAEYRHLLIEGTKGPLALYGVNVERSVSNPQSEIRDAQNVNIYYLKGETIADQNPGSSVMLVNRSKQISIFGVSGNAKPVDNALIEVRDSTDIDITNITQVSPSDAFYTLAEVFAGNTLRVPGSRVVTLFHRATPVNGPKLQPRHNGN